MNDDEGTGYTEKKEEHKDIKKTNQQIALAEKFYLPFFVILNVSPFSLTLI